MEVICLVTLVIIIGQFEVYFKRLNNEHKGLSIRLFIDHKAVQVLFLATSG